MPPPVEVQGCRVHRGGGRVAEVVSLSLCLCVVERTGARDEEVEAGK
jgi:hypothetical protein